MRRGKSKGVGMGSGESGMRRGKSKGVGMGSGESGMRRGKEFLCPNSLFPTPHSLSADF
jgi:hypothetical protein